MAITHLEYDLLAEVKNAGLFPDSPEVLELGEANWYGDVAIDRFVADIGRLVTDPVRSAMLRSNVRQVVEKRSEGDLFFLAKICFEVLLGARETTAIDMGGTASAHRWDLNLPVDLEGRQFDVTMNFGTAEHVFNVYQFFKTVHESTRPDGLMIHSGPFNGWLDHGFYCFQPTLFCDLAAANGYSILRMVHGELEPKSYTQIGSREEMTVAMQNGNIGKNAVLLSVMRKAATESDFKIPMQGYYAGSLTEDQEQAWRDMR